MLYPQSALPSLLPPPPPKKRDWVKLLGEGGKKKIKGKADSGVKWTMFCHQSALPLVHPPPKQTAQSRLGVKCSPPCPQCTVPLVPKKMDWVKQTQNKAPDFYQNFKQPTVGFASQRSSLRKTN